MARELSHSARSGRQQDRRGSRLAPKRPVDNCRLRPKRTRKTPNCGVFSNSRSRGRFAVRLPAQSIAAKSGQPDCYRPRSAAATRDSASSRSRRASNRSSQPRLAQDGTVSSASGNCVRCLERPQRFFISPRPNECRAPRPCGSRKRRLAVRRDFPNRLHLGLRASSVKQTDDKIKTTERSFRMISGGTRVSFFSAIRGPFRRRQ